MSQHRLCAAALHQRFPMLAVGLLVLQSCGLLLALLHIVQFHWRAVLEGRSDTSLHAAAIKFFAVTSLRPARSVSHLRRLRPPRRAPSRRSRRCATRCWARPTARCTASWRRTGPWTSAPWCSCTSWSKGVQAFVSQVVSHDRQQPAAYGFNARSPPRAVWHGALPRTLNIHMLSRGSTDWV